MQIPVGDWIFAWRSAPFASESSIEKIALAHSQVPEYIWIEHLLGFTWLIDPLEIKGYRQIQQISLPTGLKYYYI